MWGLRRFFCALLDFVYPPSCILCGERIENDIPICPSCWEGFLEARALGVHRGGGDFSHLTGQLYFDRVITGWTYTPEMELLIHRVKYERGRRLGVLLGRALGEVLWEFFEGWQEGVMVPVPLHGVRRRERGYNQSELLCRGLARTISVPILSKLLVRRRNTRSQTRLNAQERQENVGGAFSVHRPESVRGKNVLLVDDVCTTGATMSSCAAVLKEAGARQIVGVALARPFLEA